MMVGWVYVWVDAWVVVQVVQVVQVGVGAWMHGCLDGWMHAG